jgi:hypothetical protein
MSGPDPLILACPDWASFDNLWKNRLPFVLWPIGDRPLLADWLDYAVKELRDPVIIYAVDRPREIHTALENRRYWSRRIEVKTVSSEKEMPQEAVRVIGLSTENPPSQEPHDAKSLLLYWMQLNHQWVKRLSGTDVSIHHPHASGGWLGTRSKIHPKATLHPPFWIGPRCEIASGAVIGPAAIIGEGCIVEEAAEISHSVVLPRTYVGVRIHLQNRIADGGLLLAPERNVAITISESFLLGSTLGDQTVPTFAERMLCLLIHLLLWLPVRIYGEKQTTSYEVNHPVLPPFFLKTGSKGFLALRRHSWFMHAAKGRLRLIGVLPREESALDKVPAETADRIRAAAPGIFSLSDCHNVHDSRDCEEWVHAASQALEDPVAINRLIRKDIVRLFFLKPDIQT